MSTKQPSNKERVIMSAELASYLKESIGEIKADMKELLKQQHDQDKRLDKVEWKSGVMGLMGGVLSGILGKFWG